MARLSALVMCYSVLVLWCDHARAEEFDLNNLKSRTARSAVSDYQRKVEGAKKDLKKVVSAAKKDHEKIVAKEREKLIDALETALKKETTDGNLEEAIKLKSAITELKSQAQTEDSDRQFQLFGVWRVQYSDGLVRYNQFLLKNGQPFLLHYVKPTEKSIDKAAVVIQDGTVLVKFHRHSGIARYTITGDRMFVERWELTGENTSIDRYPDMLGIATKVEPQNEK